MRLLQLFLFLFFPFSLLAQDNLIINTANRETQSLNGEWHYIIDPYETGFYDYRFKERRENDPEAYWNNPVVKNKSDRKEHGYSDNYTLNVPGDWNSQAEVFKYYEGTVWYQREFDVAAIAEDNRYFLYFGAVNYEAQVYLNGEKLGMHKGGFTPFNFEIPSHLLKTKGNFLVVKVDNKRHPDEIPTVNTDWWNYGGITRDVKLISTPETFVEQYAIQLKQEQDIEQAKKNKSFKISGNLKFNQPASGSVNIQIPELKINEKLVINGREVSFNLTAKKLQLWSPEKPKLYDVQIAFEGNTLSDKIGFRKIEVSGKDILLNGEKIFLRGISIHEEIGQDARRANTKADAARLFKWVKDLNANMVRLAHYPHNEYMTRMADSLGVLVWSEIPVYWTINFKNDSVYQKAEKQLEEMIIRDRNKASVIIWSVGNETPVSEARTNFMKNLVHAAKDMDDSRLVSAALEVGYNRDRNYVDDPLGEYTDIVSVNEYLGWYGDLPHAKEQSNWGLAYDKPLFFSETGAGAKGDYHGSKEQRWTEEFQEWYYEETIKMMQRMPENYSGLTPWILVDFRSPRRNNPEFQEGWNRKGLIDNMGNKKKAFFTLKEYYEKMETKDE